MLLCDDRKLSAEGIDELLVGGAHALAPLEALLREGEGRFLASHRLTDDPDFRVIEDHVDVVNDTVRIGGVREIPKVQDVLHMESLRQIPLNLLLVSVNDLGYAAADRAETKDCCFNHACHLLFLFYAPFLPLTLTRCTPFRAFSSSMSPLASPVPSRIWILMETDATPLIGMDW